MKEHLQPSGQSSLYAFDLDSILSISSDLYPCTYTFLFLPVITLSCVGCDKRRPHHELKLAHHESATQRSQVVQPILQKLQAEKPLQGNER
jgi:hypothetical protein